MKRKTLDDFFPPLKLKNLENLQKSSQNPNINQINPPANELKTVFINSSNQRPDAFQILMNTPQSSTSSNFHLQYEGHSWGRHNWSYSFSNQSEPIYKSKIHKLKSSSSSVSQINLSFSTNHQGSPLHYFSIKPMPRLSPSILKSILHKSIRRRLINSSIKTALQLGCNCG